MIDYGPWRSMLGYGAWDVWRGRPMYCQFSGGRTSGFMAAMAPDEAAITFENTGCEDAGTLEFVQRVGDALKREIVWLEWRPPPRVGDPPRKFSFERVDFTTASRRGEPFAAFMEAINLYRARCGNPVIAPWAKQRLCTVYLKHKVLDHYVRTCGVTAHDRLIGIRADEPDRIPGLRQQESAGRRLLTPLYDAGVTTAHVRAFWARQSFDLQVADYDGNCLGCFLKDQADVARSLGGRPGVAAWWQGMQDKYQRFGGAKWPPYAALAAELPTRLAVEAALRSGAEPAYTGDMPRARFRLVVIQERRRLRQGATPYSCACESSIGYDEDEDDEDE